MKRSLLLIALLLATPLASARDLGGRIGLGYNSQFSNTSAALRAPGISLKYGFSRDIAMAAVLGVDTTSTNLLAMAKFFKNVFLETSLNFYFMAAAGLVGAGGTSGVEFLGGLGSEFFIPGLESLGFSFEVGISATSVSGTFAVKTIGASFLDAGIHFYF